MAGMDQERRVLTDPLGWASHAFPDPAGCTACPDLLLRAGRHPADWQAGWGHPLELAESFVDLSQFEGAVSKAANWPELSWSRGYSSSNGQCSDILVPSQERCCRQATPFGAKGLPRLMHAPQDSPSGSNPVPVTS